MHPRPLCAVETLTASPTKSTSQFCTTARNHLSMARIDACSTARSVINGLSKRISVPDGAWVWWLAAAGADATDPQVHDVLTVLALPAPLQQAGPAALHFPQSYYTSSPRSLRRQTRTAAEILTKRRLHSASSPRGAVLPHDGGNISPFLRILSPFRFRADPKDVRFAKRSSSTHRSCPYPWL